MKRYFSLTKRFPFIVKIFSNVFPKILDFTAFPSSRANINLLIEERNAYFRHVLNPTSADRWNLEIINLINGRLVSKDFLKRVGPVNDGGYFIPRNFSLYRNWITIGLGFNFNFENELAEHHCKVFTFDHTIPGRPKALNPLITYIPKGWGSLQQISDGDKVITLNTMLEISNFDPNSFWGLKFDIEGNEWDCLNQISTLSNKPAVIICELHGLIYGSNRYHNTNILEELNNLLKDYLVCFVNGNNYSPYFMTQIYGIYEIIELTLIRKDLIDSLFNLSSENNEYTSINNAYIVQMPFGLFKS